MRFCENCGNQLNDGDAFCQDCGTPVKNVEDMEVEKTSTEDDSEQKGVDYSEIATKVSENADKMLKSAEIMFGKAVKGASEAATKAAKGAGELKKSIDERAEQKKAEIEADIERQELKEAKENENKKEVHPNSFAGYMSDSELWSWLKKDSKRQQFFTAGERMLTDVEFMSKVQTKMDSNKVPAQIEQRQIQWDRSNVKQTVFIVKPNTTVVSPISYLLQFNHVGKFTYVEEKSFITPPNLPNVPTKKTPIANPQVAGLIAILFLLGLVMVLLGVALLVGRSPMGIIVLLLGALCFFGMWHQNCQSQAIIKHNNEVIKHNQKCDELAKAWRDAWTNWENSIFLHAFQEDINGQLSRIYDSVFGCIKQVCSEEFEDCAREQEDSSNLNELEQLIARRKDDYR